MPRGMPIGKPNAANLHSTFGLIRGDGKRSAGHRPKRLTRATTFWCVTDLRPASGSLTDHPRLPEPQFRPTIRHYPGAARERLTVILTGGG